MYSSANVNSMEGLLDLIIKVQLLFTGNKSLSEYLKENDIFKMDLGRLYV